MTQVSWLAPQLVVGTLAPHLLTYVLFTYIRYGPHNTQLVGQGAQATVLFIMGIPYPTAQEGH